MFVYPWNICEIRVWNSFFWHQNGCLIAESFLSCHTCIFPSIDLQRTLRCASHSQEICWYKLLLFPQKRKRNFLKVLFWKSTVVGQFHDYSQKCWNTMAGQGCPIFKKIHGHPGGRCQGDFMTDGWSPSMLSFKLPVTWGSLMEKTKRARLFSSLQKS